MATQTNPLSLDQMDEITTIQMCLSAVANLAIPSDDLTTVKREDLACLLSYLTDRLEKTINRWEGA
ncbi:hypothetical protein [Methylovulum psychrotolerans]|uniref:Uncharacterized protein n=1 Tax=Methylovulum psychrotolerans TaxID=1704499 RepID=A0A2S5CLI6_9GAMM|nr:hypothetical protein [Methylovulum psychrotolerans]POZ51679.1 hypothetical protein AADEFJLK_02549 [Methylovulum psychrotolerans]